MTTTAHPASSGNPAAVLTAARDVAARPRTTSWRERYVLRLGWTDAAVVTASVVVAQLVRFGHDPQVRETGQLGVVVGYTAVSIGLGLAWWVSLALFRSRDTRVVGDGVEEYRRVAHSSLALFRSIAIAAFLTQADIARGYLAIALPAGLLEIQYTIVTCM